jgi:arabinofuranan 3-O-arabinosyltransferase
MRLLRDRWSWAALLWPVALVAFAFRVAESQRVPGFDLYIVQRGVDLFLHGQSPYGYHFFIYPPSGGLLLSWLGPPGFGADRALFLAVGVAAILAGGAMALRLAGHGWRGPAGALMVLGLAVYYPVYLTLQFGNVNSLIFLAEVLALVAMANGRYELGAVPLGLSLAIKPILVPLLVFPLIRRRWRALAIAVAPVIVLSGLAIALDSAASDFFRITLPFLVKGDTSFFTTHNVSIAGAVVNLGLPKALGAVVRLVVAAVVVWVAAARWKERGGDGTALRVVEVATLLLVGTFLCFSIAWTYYGLYLVPALATISHQRSMLRHPLVLVGLFLAGSPDTLQLDRLHRATERFGEVRPTLGFGLLIAGMAGVLLGRRASQGQTAPGVATGSRQVA